MLDGLTIPGERNVHVHGKTKEVQPEVSLIARRRPAKPARYPDLDRAGGVGWKHGKLPLYH